MTLGQYEILIVASIVAVSCALVGVFLVLRKMAMMSDAITHTVLLGIVLGFFVTHDLSSPLLLVGALIMGIITVYLVETLQRTRLLSEEASIGVVFPLIFSIAIVLISRYAGNVHLDTDAVLLGELAFIPLDRMTLFGLSFPVAYVNTGLILLIDIVVINLFFKELQLSSFDALLAATLGFSPIFLNYLLMTLVSITAVGAFNAVGSVLVIAFMIGPPITAYLLTHDLKKMIALSVFFAIFNVVLGYGVAMFFDVSIAGSMALVTGLTFIAMMMLNRDNGYLSTRLRIRKQRHSFSELVILFYLNDHDTLDKEVLFEAINWDNHKIKTILDSLEKHDEISIHANRISVTDNGIHRINDQEAIIFDR